MGQSLRDNGLTSVRLGLFLVPIVGQGIAGGHEYHDDQFDHGQVLT